MYASCVSTLIDTIYSSFTSHRHADREAEPKNYDVCKSDERNLLRATYDRIGNITDGVCACMCEIPFLEYIYMCIVCSYLTQYTQSLSDCLTTQQEGMSEVHKLKKDFETRDTHKSMVTDDNFDGATSERETGKPQHGYGSVLPRHRPEHGMRHLSTTQRIDYRYPFEWTPKPEEVRMYMCNVTHPQPHTRTTHIIHVCIF